MVDALARATFTESGFLIVMLTAFVVGSVTGWASRSNWWR